MIRRDGQKPAGSASWVLISQIEHARLAGDLARHWNSENGQPIGHYQELIAAIYHHDDGWAEWERAPQVDPAEARPRSFTEMPLEQSLVIWQASIEAAEQIGPFAAWLVAGHFGALLRGSEHSMTPAANHWLALNEARRTSWLAAWQADAPDRPLHQAEIALRYLQAFDSLSLWFCCAEREAPLELTMPCGNPQKLIPQSPSIIILDPWPLQVDSLEIGVVGSSIPETRYADNTRLAVAPRQPVQLYWHLKPA